MVTSDYLPTILAASGLPVSEKRPLDGINLLPVLEQNLQERKQSIGFQFQNKAVWMTQRYKLLSSGKRGKEQCQLFDLLADPGETTDVSQDHPDLVKQYRRDLDAWIKSCDNSNQGNDY